MQFLIALAMRSLGWYPNISKLVIGNVDGEKCFVCLPFVKNINEAHQSMDVEQGLFFHERLPAPRYIKLEKAVSYPARRWNIRQNASALKRWKSWSLNTDDPINMDVSRWRLPGVHHRKEKSRFTFVGGRLEICQI